MRAPIVVPIEVRNPGAYLAACGVVEIAGAFDSRSTSHWERRPVLLGTAQMDATACIIQTTIPEAELAAALFEALSCRNRWEAVTLDGRRAPLHEVGNDEPLTAVRVCVHLRERLEHFPIDYWYHLLGRADDAKLKDKLKEGKSVWKFWSGRMSVQKTLLGENRKPGLISSLSGPDGQPVQDFAGLLSVERQTGSSLNLDAAARRGALDRGIAANEAKRAEGDVAAVRPALELLAAIGLSAFFPPRRLGATRENGIHSTVGSDGQHLRYSAWATESPLALARLLARGQQVEGTTNLESMEARRVNAGGKIYRFDYSRGIGFVPPRLTKSKEEDDVGADTDAG
jgi:CRISPR-associated protein Csb3